MKSIKFGNVLQITKPEYVFLKLKPNNSIRNNTTHKLARAIGTLYKSIVQNIKIEEKKLLNVLGRKLIVPTKFNIQFNAKVAYYIYIEKQKIEFYFIIPKQYCPFLKEKISDIWSNITIDEVDTLPTFRNDATKYQLIYRKEDGLSLASDRRDNDLLNSNLNVVELLENGDKVGLYYNFIPTFQNSWKYKYKHTIEKLKNGKPVERNKFGWAYLLKWGLSTIDSIMNSLTEALSGKHEPQDGESNLLTSIIDRLNGSKQIGQGTIKKGRSIVLDTQIVVLSESEDKIREHNAAKSLAQSFDTISEDNELIPKTLRKKNFNFTDYSVANDRIKVGDEEAQNFLSLAGRELLEKYNIERVETHETMVEEDLREGILCIGTNRFRGVDTKAYLSNDPNFKNLLALLIGSTRSGKTTLIRNLCINAIEDGKECAVVFDFIENCSLSDEIASAFPKDKVLEIRCDDISSLQGFGYNEVGYSDDPFIQYGNAKRQTANLVMLIDAINNDESKLSPKMDRYLESASLVVFISNGSIKDVFDVLLNHNVRHKFLNKVPRNQYENLSEYMDSLRELDEVDKKTDEVTGTHIGLCIGIVDRLNALKRNQFLELMLKKDMSKNINFVDEIQKNQLIVIKMPESIFTTSQEKDVLCLYFLSKLWLAAMLRADKIRDKSKRISTLVVFDELYQVEQTQKFLTSKLSQAAKFGLKTLVSAHYLSQLRYLRDEARSANASYLLLSGADKANFKELAAELQPFKEEDLLSLPRYHALCLVRGAKQYARFIVKMPPDVKRNFRPNKKGLL